MFLTRPGQPRQEVELVGPPALAESADQEAAEPLPETVCPHGAPESGDDLPAPPAPGVSWYESFLWRIPNKVWEFTRSAMALRVLLVAKST